VNSLTSKTTSSKAFAAELCEQESKHTTRAATIRSVAAAVGCHAETLRSWLRDAEREDGPTCDE